MQAIELILPTHLRTHVSIWIFGLSFLFWIYESVPKGYKNISNALYDYGVLKRLLKLNLYQLLRLKRSLNLNLYRLLGP